ncbi:MAG: hypothetical protein JXB07_13970 [Anaerolineae bacterium]|nr:hypothetical protein [Anaerolineae bacterium]
MDKFAKQGILWLCVAVLVMVLAGCKKEAQSSATPVGAIKASSMLSETPDPAISRTLQAEVAMTAAWLLTLTPNTLSSGKPSPTWESPGTVGTPMADRRGECPIPPGFVLHDREGFCLATPPSWVVFNIDGGVAGFLKTTPGQAIGLQPGWAQSSVECNLLVYISSEDALVPHLDLRYRQFAGEKDIDISPIQAYVLGDMGLLGFTWSYEEGESGAVYADMIGRGRLLHISYDGSNCLSDSLLPVLETLRID